MVRPETGHRKRDLVARYKLLYPPSHFYALACLVKSDPRGLAVNGAVADSMTRCWVGFGRRSPAVTVVENVVRALRICGVAIVRRWHAALRYLGSYRGLKLRPAGIAKLHV